MLKLWSNGFDFIIAHTQLEALNIIAPIYGYKIPVVKRDAEELECDGWHTLDDDKEFVYFDEEKDTKDKKTVREWVKLNGIGYFASSEY